MNYPNGIRIIRILKRIAGTAAFLALLWLIPGASAAERHTILLRCGGGGYVGTREGRRVEQVLTPAENVRSLDGRVWTIEELKNLSGFELHGAALRWTVKRVNGLQLEYALACGRTRSVPQRVLPGRNLWNVTDCFKAWLEDSEQELRLTPAYQRETRGVLFAEGSAVLQVTFSADDNTLLFLKDRVDNDMLYDASLSLLEAGSPFIERYDETGESLMRPLLELGVPYYYAGRNEDKFLHVYYPQQTTRYYRDDRKYLCGLDCVGLTQLVLEKRGLPAHPSIPSLIYRGIGTAVLSAVEPEDWPLFLQPGDLIAIDHGTNHILMYLGTMRMFGWTEEDAGEALPVLDAPLVIHCGDNPFYYDRYEPYIREHGYRDTYPPDGGVTVSVIQRTIADAPHHLESSWGKEFGWYLADGSPLLVFPLEDCAAIAWYDPLP